MFLAPVRGMVAAADIVAFVLLVGGTFGVLERSGALEAGISALVGRLQRRAGVLIPVSMLAFAVGGAVFGMSEEVIPFVLLFVPLMRGLGYPRIIAAAVPLVGAGVGFAGAMLNPFTVGVAQAIAGLPPMSGWPYRTFVWVVCCVVGIVYVARMAAQLRTAPPEVGEDQVEKTSVTPAQALVLLAFAATIVFIGVGVVRWEWYVEEIAAAFVAMGILAALLLRLDSHATCEAMIHGANALLPAALVIGLARGIVLLAADMHVLDTTLHGAALAMEGLHPTVSVTGMFTFQLLFNILVPSGSGQAALTMPIMAPLSDLIGLNRQIAVLAFQLGDGFTNLITPTSAVLLGSLHAAGVGFDEWVRRMWKLQLWLFLAGVAVLWGALAIGYGG
ncbi:MAG: YfcC family protein, partial [Myxococcales bacterium]|nr:YfcC family protein [Myxococcales bacterium]